MKFPDDVTVFRPYGEDFYGNPGNSWADPTVIEAKGFQASSALLLMPADADVKTGDRVEVRGRRYSAEVEIARSPGRDVLALVRLGEIPKEAP